MPKFFCKSHLRSNLLVAVQTNNAQGDYCDVYLTHDSMSVRKAHNAGRNHLRNVQAYYERTRVFLYYLKHTWKLMRP